MAQHTQGPRIAAAQPPHDADIQNRLDAIMPDGVPPLTLFTTLARNPRVFERMMSGGLLDKGTLTLRQRELMIDRTTARCGAEYEWGVHMTFFGDRVAITKEQSASTVRGTPQDTCWDTENDRLILQMADALHDTSTIDDTLWAELAAEFSDEQIIELVVLAGYYHTISFCCRAFNLDMEEFGARFEAA